jgi:hypothetical protein
MIDNVEYKKYEALARYVDRIGAECRNFRRYLIVEYKARGYYNEKCTISLEDDGMIKVTDLAYAPTKDEQEAICAGYAEAVKWFPKSVMATEAKMAELRKIAGADPLLYQFYSRKKNVSSRTGNIIMVQQRKEATETSDKKFTSWTFFDDGKWRAMEPDGKLPFWKPKLKDGEERGGRMIMVHEGPKTAKHLNELKQKPKELAKHPYGEILGRYEHWGMIGGALVPHRSDWEDLTDEKPLEVIYVCDNDPPGKDALQKVSKNYNKALLGVVFDKNFKDAFDFGDEMPPELFQDGVWVGPKFEDLLTFATHATQKIKDVDKPGKPIAIVTDAFANEWYHCVTPEIFVHSRWPQLLLGPNEFNNRVAPFSDVDDTARLLRKRNANKTAVLAYNPSKQSGIYADQNGTYINTFVDSYIEEKEGDPKPFLDFMDHLVPNRDDRKELLRWIATLIARPDIKMLYGTLLISEAQGIGKGTLGERVLAPIIGGQNVSYPSEQEIVDSNYNYWAAHKRLAVVHEIYAGHSARAYNRLKSIVTDRHITVSKKYMANYEIENWIHILACSNSTRAIQLSMDDRRWFVPKLTEEKKPTKYWGDFNDWLVKGGLSVIRWWAAEYLKENSPVLRGESAPWSAAKKDIVEDGYSPGMNLAGQLFDFLRHQLTSEEIAAAKFRDSLRARNMFREGAAIICDVDVCRYISLKLYDGRANDRLEKPGTVRKVAKARGWHVGDEKVWHYKWGQDRYGARLISFSPQEAGRKPSEVELSPVDLNVVEGL